MQRLEFRFNPSDKKITLAVNGKTTEHSSLTRVIRGRFFSELSKALRGNRSFDLILIEKEDKDVTDKG